MLAVIMTLGISPLNFSVRHGHGSTIPGFLPIPAWATIGLHPDDVQRVTSPLGGEWPAGLFEGDIVVSHGDAEVHSIPFVFRVVPMLYGVNLTERITNYPDANVTDENNGSQGWFVADERVTLPPLADRPGFNLTNVVITNAATGAVIETAAPEVTVDGGGNHVISFYMPEVYVNVIAFWMDTRLERYELTLEHWVDNEYRQTVSRGEFFWGQLVNLNDVAFGPDVVFSRWQLPDGVDEIGGFSAFSLTAAPDLRFLMPREATTVIAHWASTFTIQATGLFENYSILIDGAPADSISSGLHGGESVEIYVGTRPGYTFNGWTAQGVTLAAPSNETIAFPMPSNNVALTANWTEIQQTYTVTFTAGANGSISATDNGTAITSPATVVQGNTVIFTATSNTGYRVANWTISGGTFTGDTSGNTRTVIVGANVTVNVTFESISVPPTLSLNPTAITVNDANLSVTSTIGGTATGTIQISDNLPSGVTATVNQADGVITVTGVRPAAGQSAITGNFNITVTRQGITQTLAVSVNLQPLPPNQHSVTVTTQGSGTASASPAAAVQGTQITLTATPSGGHRFVEWQVVSGGVTITNATSATATFTMPNNAVTVRAVFELIPQTFTIAFNANGGTGTMASQTVAQGSNFNIPANAFTRSNHTFAGWNTAANGSGTAYAAGATIENVQGSMTLFAQWTPVGVTHFTVTFNLNGGNHTGGGALTQSVPAGGAATAPTVSRTNHRFDGWDRGFSNVTSNITVNAMWTYTGTPGTGNGTWQPTPTVTAVTVRPEAATVQTGQQQQFTATVSGTHNPWQGVTWRVEGNASPQTAISANGLLTVAANETAATLTVRATSRANTNVSGTATVTVTQPAPTPTPTPDPTPEPTPTPDPTPPCWCESGEPLPFEDVRETDWFYRSIRYVFCRSLMVGDGTGQFSPNRNVTRAMVVQVLHNIMGNPDVDGLPNPFTDVAADKWYHDAVVWAANNGLVSGFGDGRFGPGENITRAHLAVILNRYAEWMDIELPVLRDLSPFADDTDIRSYAREAIDRFFQAMIIGGYPDGTFQPQDEATRAEFAAMLTRFIPLTESTEDE